VANVHRLDADTSGILLCAKTKPALDFLSGQFQSKTVEKKYHAFVAVLPPEHAMKVIVPIRDATGALPDSFTVELALGEDERQPGRMRVFKGRGGKDCVTEFRTLERFRGSTRPAPRSATKAASVGTSSFAFIECRPLTGRTHQLRVHLAHGGHPIVGDKLYGPSEDCYLTFIETGWTPSLAAQLWLPRQALHSCRLTVDGHDWQTGLPPDLLEWVRL
jgi:23S rRNA-/tRNA-specific pseudouridylate synthase